MSTNWRKLYDKTPTIELDHYKSLDKIVNGTYDGYTAKSWLEVALVLNHTNAIKVILTKLQIPENMGLNERIAYYQLLHED